MQIDTQKFLDLSLYLNLVWTSPLQIVLAMYFLWNILGPSSLAGRPFITYGLLPITILLQTCTNCTSHAHILLVVGVFLPAHHDEQHQTN